MKNLLVFLGLLCLFSCRKTEAEKKKEALAGLNGTWIGIGHSFSSGSIPAPDAFYPIRVHVIDANVISVFGDTLPLATDQSNDDSAVFKYVPDSYPVRESATLVYHKRTHVVSYSRWAGSYYGHGSFYLSSADYRSNPLLKDIVRKLSGTRIFSGTVHNVSYGPPSDTTYETSIQVTFTIVNDSTLAFNKSILTPDGDTLHYKTTDNSANTVTFESFHFYDDDITTVTYNAASNAVTLKEWRGNYPYRVDVDLK